jgi:hypothetical protein
VTVTVVSVQSKTVVFESAAGSTTTLVTSYLLEVSRTERIHDGDAGRVFGYGQGDAGREQRHLRRQDGLLRCAAGGTCVATVSAIGPAARPSAALTFSR